jgi:hypothetical protein
MTPSLFLRVRRAEIGSHHHIAGPYFAAYVAKMACGRDNRRLSNGEQNLMTAKAALAHPVSGSGRAIGSARKMREALSYLESHIFMFL